eukprot:5345537-Prymnesium_polylepis.1
MGDPTKTGQFGVRLGPVWTRRARPPPPPRSFEPPANPIARQVGFNSVYHLTDTPMFISGKHFCIFDPHRRCLPDKAGGMLSDMHEADHNGSGQTFCRQFADQMAPFEAMKDTFGWSIDEAGKGSWGAQGRGTLFRFPLRTAAQASTSKIKGGLK